ncbi:tudor domain-containing protein 5-like isoform X2 [Littorina saxatilis]|uniref:tudor domain-containing protein 5-like isoform X2 n=1 Tax=Littorina saxatilis TaxID=31220 RepID=UPI0038B609C7
MGEKDANALSNIKSLFRSILITVQGGLTVQEFQRDYRDFVGTPIPYTDFGFQSLKPFLLSLKDTVQFFTSNGEERLRQVSTEDTKHIEVMVQRQKPSQKKRRSSGSRSRNFSSSNSRGGRGGGNFSRERRIVSKTHQSGLLGQLPLATWNPNTGQRIPPLHGYSAPSRYQNDVYAYPQPPRLSRSDQSNGRSITRSHGNGWKSPGYQSEIMQDKSQSSRSSERTSSHSQSQTRTQTQSGDNLQQNSRSKPCEQDQGEQKLSPRSDQSEGGSDSSSQGRRSTTYRGRGRGRVKGVERKPQWSEPEYKQQFAETKDHANSQQLSRYDSDNWEEEEKPKQRQGGVKMSQDICDISQDVQNKVKQVLVKAPRGLWANRLPVMYKTMFDQELPLRDQGYHSVIEFVSAMPHIVRVERPYEKGDWMLSDATQARKGGDDLLFCYDEREPLCKEEKLAVQMKMIPEKSPSAERTQELQESVLQVLQSHTDGVALHHFKEVYQEMTGLTLDYGEKDMNSLLVLLAHCGVLRMEYSGPNTSRLYAVPNSDVRRFDYLKDAYKPHSFETAFTELVERDDSLPSDAVGPGVFYKPAVISNLQQGTKDNSVYYEMHVSNVVSPGLFWLQRRENVTALDELMDALEAVYNQQGDLYRMPESMMVHGQVCVTLFPEDNNWHRAIITGGTHSMVQVYYVDYGNTCSVPASTIRFLKKKFLSMPVQAIQAKMAYLFPPPGQQTFTPESKQALLDMVIMKPLMALIADIQNRVLSVVLVDTNGDNDIFINDYLVTNGHAIFEKEVSDCLYTYVSLPIFCINLDGPHRQVSVLRSVYEICPSISRFTAFSQLQR